VLRYRGKGELVPQVKITYKDGTVEWTEVGAWLAKDLSPFVDCEHGTLETHVGEIPLDDVKNITFGDQVWKPNCYMVGGDRKIRLVRTQWQPYVKPYIPTPRMKEVNNATITTIVTGFVLGLVSVIVMGILTKGSPKSAEGYPLWSYYLVYGFIVYPLLGAVLGPVIGLFNYQSNIKHTTLSCIGIFVFGLVILWLVLRFFVEGVYRI
jgi:hypothetical protein